jgi:hypothetical protein
MSKIRDWWRKKTNPLAWELYQTMNELKKRISAGEDFSDLALRGFLHPVEWDKDAQMWAIKTKDPTLKAGEKIVLAHGRGGGQEFAWVVKSSNHDSYYLDFRDPNDTSKAVPGH